MEKKTFKIEAYFIISSFKKSDPELFLIKNEKNEMDCFKRNFTLEGLSFNVDKARDLIRDFLVESILPKGIFVSSQKMVFDKIGKQEFRCKYYINLTEKKLQLKNGSFVLVHKAIDVKNNLSPFLREFLINYVEKKKNIYEETSS